ncbi:MAG TPA: aminodeoxychorismate synthase component I [Gemmatimonadales bacterium]|nr:aminodeoxychorismate synthase component I [Gemmatimonadales bacterium]
MGAGLTPLPLVQPLDPVPDPLDVFARVRDLPVPLLLDSAADPRGIGRHSFVMADPVALVRGAGGGGPGRDALAAAEAALRDALATWPVAPVPGLPPFQGGLAGYVGYEFGTTLEPRVPRPAAGALPLPDVLLGLYDWVVAWDHQAARAWVLSTGLPERAAARERRAAARLKMVLERLGGEIPSGRARRLAPTTDGSGSVGASAEARPTPESPPLHPVPGREAIALRSTFTRAGYLRAVERVRAYIAAGDVFQVNLAQRFEAPLAEAPWEFYRRLRRRNPAPFGAFLDLGDTAIVSVSPERFVSLDPAGAVETRPIKGTRPRGGDPAGDAALAAELAASAKDRAENVMIVDLLRNDLSRVCVPGSVAVPSLLALEAHPTVHHLVSTVTGRLDAGATAFELLRAAFPGGSITGAPKVRAMEIIAELEPTPRGVYCGAIGYVSTTGALDTSIAIRTATVTDGRLHVHAGGGIVYDSSPEAEYAETLAKVRAFVEALEEAAWSC